MLKLCNDIITKLKKDNKTKEQRLHQQTAAMNQELMLSAVRQNELAESTGVASKKLEHNLEAAATYAENIIDTVREPLLVLDSALKIISANRSFYVSFKVTPQETIGKLIYDLGNRQWDIPKLRTLLEEILPKDNKFDDYEVEHEFSNIGHKIMLLNARRVTQQEIGYQLILLAIEDITERREIENGLEKARKELVITKISEDEAREYAESIINTVREPLIALDQDLRVVTASRSFYVVFKVKPEETVGQLIYDLGNKQWDIPKLRELLGTILPQKATFDNYKVEHDFATIGRRTMLLNARQIHRVLGKERIILLAIEDITEKMRLQHELAERTRDAEKAQFEAEAATRANEDIIETVREPLLVLNSDLRVLSANRSFYVSFKVTPEETIGNLIYDLGNRQWDIPKLRTLLEEILPKDNKFDDYEVEHEFSNIGHKIMLLNARRVTQQEIGTQLILLAIEDVTERREIENGLERTRKELEVTKISEDKAREYAESIINTVREPLLVLDSDLRVVKANLSFYDSFKVTPEETIGNLIYSLGNRQWDIPGLRTLLEEIIPKDTKFDGYQIDHIFPSIGRKIMLLNARQVLTEEIDNKLLLLAIEDVTERILIEEELKESAEGFKRLFETAKDGLLLLNKQTGEIIEVNKSVTEMLGYSSEELIGKKVQDAGILTHIKDFNETILELIKTGLIDYEDVLTNTRDGQILHTDIYLVDRARLIQCNIRDITDRILSEDKVKRDIEKLAALRQIDTAILGSLDLHVTLNVLLEQTMKQLHVDAACVLLFNPHDQMLEYAMGHGFHKKRITLSRIRFGQGYAGRVAMERKTIAIPSIDNNHDDIIPWHLIEEEGFKAYIGVPLIAKGQVKGVLEIFNRTPLDPDMEWLEFTEALAGQAAIALDSAELFEQLERSNSELLTAYDTTIEGWSRALDYRDKETEGHSIRVTEMAVRVCKAIGMSDEELVHVRRGALLHDIGKLGVPDGILLKPGTVDG